MPDEQPSIHDTLKTVFGFDGFRDGQERIIRQILDGHSALAVFPTGSGKSLCYQLPALLLDGLTLVVSPLIALMKDQIDFLHRHNIPAARLDSTVPLDEFRRIDADLSAGRLKLLYIAPERLSNERFISKLRRLRPALLVIDEAHCISEWGHNFRPDYLKLARLRRDLAIPQVLALTATATPPVAADICKEFSIAPEAFVHTGSHRPNLILRATPCPDGRRRTDFLIERLRQRPRGPTIVYTTLQRTAEEVATALTRQGIAAQAYHAGMDSEDRAAVQDWFMGTGHPIVTATIAFGMGIDKSDIRYVYHYNLPKSLENYSQEIGRAGRDGHESTCEMFVNGSDLNVLENFTYGDTPDPAALDSLITHLLRQPDEFDISAYELSRDHDMRPLVIGTLLTYLELAGVTEATAPFYNEYQFRPLRPSADILARFDPERAAFLRKLLASARKATTWFNINLDTTAAKLGETRERLVRALTYLEEQGHLTLKVAGARQGYRFTARPDDHGAALRRTFADRFALRERNDIARARQVADLASQPGCIVRRLLEHYGETLENNAPTCGHCGPCLGDPPAAITRPTNPPALDHATLAALKAAHPAALATPRQVARFLCGIGSPRLTNAKLSKHDLFGSLAETPFQLVMQQAGK